MSSVNKKKKEKNSYSHHGMALKLSSGRIRGLMYFNASQRRRNRREAARDVEDELGIGA